MNESRIKLFIITQRKKFPLLSGYGMETTMKQMSDQEITMVESLDYKDPNMVFFISFFFGYMGIDRFIIGDTLLGVLKLVTFGGCCIWTLIDWFLIIDRTRELNLEKFNQIAQSVPTTKL